MADVAERLASILAELDQMIAELVQLGLSDTAKLLRIGRLDIQLRAHNISDEEFRAFCEAIEKSSTTAKVQESVVVFPAPQARKRTRQRLVKASS